MGSSKKPIFALFSLFLIISTSFAASGGRMGGDSFSDRKSSSSSSSSSSYDSSHSDHRHHHHHYYHRIDDTGYMSSSNYQSKGSRPIDDGDSTWIVVILFCAFTGLFFWLVYRNATQNKSSVIMVQVGLTGKANSLQRQLNEIAKTTDTSSSKGWQIILIETVAALLQHPHYIISGYSSVKHHGSDASLEESFRLFRMEEREKVDMESLTNVNNVRRQRAVIPKASKLGRDYIVVTILVAVQGSYNVPAVKSIDDLKKVLKCLNFASEKLLAVEVLWTPQDESDSLSEDELLEDYPLLRPI